MDTIDNEENMMLSMGSLQYQDELLFYAKGDRILVYDVSFCLFYDPMNLDLSHSSMGVAPQ